MYWMFMSFQNLYVETLIFPPWACIKHKPFKEVIRVKQNHNHEALIQYNWCPYKKKKIHQRSLSPPTLWGYSIHGHHLQAKMRVLSRIHLCWHLDLRFQHPELWENKFLLFKQPSLWYFFYGSLSRLRQRPPYGRVGAYHRRFKHRCPNSIGQYPS